MRQSVAEARRRICRARRVLLLPPDLTRPPGVGRLTEMLYRIRRRSRGP
jgi:hypothetical protein